MDQATLQQRVRDSRTHHVNLPDPTIFTWRRRVYSIKSTNNRNHSFNYRPPNHDYRHVFTMGRANIERQRASHYHVPGVFNHFINFFNIFRVKTKAKKFQQCPGKKSKKEIFTRLIIQTFFNHLSLLRPDIIIQAAQRQQQACINKCYNRHNPLYVSILIHSISEVSSIAVNARFLKLLINEHKSRQRYLHSQYSPKADAVLACGKRGWGNEDFVTEYGIEGLNGFDVVEILLRE